MSLRLEKFSRDKKTILRWLVVFLLLFLAYWWVMANFVIPDFWDTQYALKPALLRKRIAEYPGHPLILFMGSSRVEDGLRPALLAGNLKEPNTPLVFNFGLSGADLFREYICLRRLIADGIKPQRVGIEILGPLMHHTEPLDINDGRYLVRARRDEVDLFASYSANPDEMRKKWRWSRINPNDENGMVVPGQTRMIRLIPLPFVWPLGEGRPYDDWGWFGGVTTAPSEMEFQRRLDFNRTQFKGWFQAPEITPDNDRILHQMLDLCKKNGIDAFLFRMPEVAEYQAFYPPAANGEMDAYLHKIDQEYGVPLIDARSWVGRSGFSDGQHLNRDGAQEFTLRLGRELIAATPQAPAR